MSAEDTTAIKAISALRGLFPPAVAVAARSIALDADAPEAIRRRHRRSGRLCAADALAVLAISPTLREHPAPTWPSDAAGSISHCEDLACAVAAQASQVVALGVDIEAARPLIEGAELVCGDAELDHFDTLPPLPAGNWPLLTFSAKEAFYKCQYAVTGRLLDFRDFEIRFDIHAPATGRFTLRRTRPLPIPDHLDLDIEGRWAADRSHVYTAAWITRPAP
ncbi:4'-phosphopantetheinyl transferase family protein [Caulobacter soli]|uniref:4'-phosphopantetheinyl transferase family protein n=1 Tax=Caulobacter soli TaxID=2708539 RepID=UPI0013EDC9E6|nr:4'-phosphopantetheinyl transferase superfamily protein [Caulobacter soli]